MDACRLSDESCCLFCGYALRGLPTCICPECGRAFDPANPRTFDSAPRRSRRRRRGRRAVALAICGAVIFTLWPRGFRTLSVTFGCPNCTETLMVRRVEPITAPWLPIRVPAWREWTRVAASPSNGDVRPCPDHHPGNAVVGFNLGRMSVGNPASSPMTRSGTLVINGMPLTIDTAEDVLDKLSAPSALNGPFSMQIRPLADDRRRGE